MAEAEAEAGTKRFKDDRGGIHYPEPIIHHIQSFLDPKEAAQTTLLSKAWYKAWLTRPNLHFNDRHFCKYPGERFSKPKHARVVAAFWNFVTKTMQRYEDLNLQIDTFELWVTTHDSDPKCLSTEFLTKVVKMGVKEIDLSAYPPHFCKCIQVRSPQTLPREVLDVETLVRLSVRGWTIDRPPAGMVNHSRLKSLTLELMYIGGDCFSLMFPCLEDLTLKNCTATEPIQISSPSLKYLYLVSVDDLKAKFDVPSIRKFKYSSVFPEVLPRVSFPVLTFSKVSKEMECDISLTFCGSVYRITKTRFYELRKFMKKLSGSKVSLAIHEDGSCAYDKELKGKQGPVVDNLALSLSLLPSSCRYFLAGLFWSCPPKCITLSWFSGSCISAEEKASNEFIMFLCEELILNETDCPTMDLVKNRNHDLGEVKIERFDTTCAKWLPFPEQIFFLAPMSLKNVEKFRFSLEWREKAPPMRHATRSARMLQNKELHPQPMEPSVHNSDH